MESPIELSLVIPVYNGSAFLSEKISVFLTWLRGGTGRELVVVDDGSVDTTAALLETIRLEPRCRIIRQDHNCGKGAALRTGLAAATGTYVGFTDADLPYGLPVLDGMLEILKNNVRLGIVYGSRSHRESSGLKNYGWLRTAGRYFFSFIIRWGVSTDVVDSQCGIKMFSRVFAQEIIRRARIDRFAADVELFAIAKVLGYEYCDFGVTLTHRRESSVRLFKDTVLMLKDIVRIRYRVKHGRYNDKT